MAQWYVNAIENARLCPTAQEYHNSSGELQSCGMMDPNPRGFVDSLNVFDCSKVSDGASAIVVVSEEGLKLGTVECHDCFTIAGILAVEAIGFAPHGGGAEFILQGNTKRTGKIPFNTTGGLVGWGHPTGATGVHQAVTILE